MASSSTSAASFELELLQLIRERGCDVAGSQQYPYPCHVHTASFVSIKLSGKANYDRWQEQMMCLLESHGMQGFIDGRLRNPKENGDSKKKAGETTVDANYGEWKRSDTLVKGWIFGSLSEDVMGTVVGLHTANDVWKKLKTIYSTPAAPTTTTTSSTSTSTKDLAEYIPLYRAILEGDWEKAQELFNKDKNALTAKLNMPGHRALHIAISTGDIQFVGNLLKEINPKLLPTLVNNFGLNPAHYAAMVGNTAAAKMFVKENPHLLFIFDKGGYLPIHRAVFSPHMITFRYLLEVSKQYIGLSQQEGYHSPFEGRSGALLLTGVIDGGILDVACELLKEYPDIARTKYKDIDTPLVCTAGKLDLYYSGTRYNFYQRFVYSHVPIENNSLGYTDMVQDIENQKTYKDKVVTKCRRSPIRAVGRRIYVKFWEIALLHVSHIKEIKEDKVKHDKALTLLRCICEEVGKTNRHSDMGDHYFKATNLAAANNTPEAIEEMVRYFPQAIWSNMNGYYIIQLVIVNRCEKVYNLLVHQMNVNLFLHKAMKDKDGNSLLHLAGQLAPIHKLNLVSGAALQMQRELQWFQEVEKFVQPKYKEEKNNKQETPIMVFRREHKELRKEGEEWMKKTADSYTITTALIVTIVFAAAITVPGGNDGNTGKAIYTKRAGFIIFAVSDAISLFTSTTSLLLFLSILTSRYADEDFLYTLPKRLILGLATLFLSVTSMMVAFSATLYLVVGHEKAFILIPIAALTCLPIASFVTLQLPLLVELISSSYGRGIFGKQSDRRILQHSL